MVIAELIKQAVKGIHTGYALFVFPLSLLELSSIFVELHLAYLRASRMLRALCMPLIGKTSATVHSDTTRKSHDDGEGT